MVGVNQRFFIQCNIFLENLWDRTVWDRIYFTVKKKKGTKKILPNASCILSFQRKEKKVKQINSKGRKRKYPFRCLLSFHVIPPHILQEKIGN